MLLCEDILTCSSLFCIHPRYNAVLCSILAFSTSVQTINHANAKLSLVLFVCLHMRDSPLYAYMQKGTPRRESDEGTALANVYSIDRGDKQL